MPPTPGSEQIDGEDVISDVYSAAWARAHHTAVKKTDPSGVMLALAVGWDKSSTSKVQNALPVYARSLAEPYESACTRRAVMLVGYVEGLPDAVTLQMSDERARIMRALFLRAWHTKLFDEYDGLGNPAQMGEMFLDATGTPYMVYVRFGAMILDMAEAFPAAGLLLNRGCLWCECLTGSFHLFDRAWPLRSCARETEERAEAELLRTREEREFALQTSGLHTMPGVVGKVPGLDSFMGLAIPTLHMVHQGIWKIIVTCALQQVQADTPRGAPWRRLVRQIDAWVVKHGRAHGSTSFSKRLSHYM